MSIRQGNNVIAGAVGTYPLNERNVTNCITEIPQDIKLELSSGTLTLKAGSKVYVPNGAGVFDEITIASDLTHTYSSATDTFMVFYDHSAGVLRLRPPAESFSGTTAPTASTYEVWYDTTNNIIKYSTDTGSTWSRQYSFPICIASTTSGVGFTSIDQVFNGFGYIGSTVFALPGVKGLMPSGRNADGSLKNIEITVSNVITQTNVSPNLTLDFIVRQDGISGGISDLSWNYNEAENQIYNSIGAKANWIPCVRFSADSNSKIALFNPKTVFHAVDYSDTDFIVNQSMPSNRYIDLTLGASGASYTAPADGYVSFCKVAQEFPREILVMNDAGMTSQIISSANGQWLRAWLPVRKGSSFTVVYDITGSTMFFRFVYANGAI